MAEREALTAVLNRWHTLQETWDDRCSTRLQETILEPLGEQTKLLEAQEAEIFHFISLIEEELDTLQPGS